MAKPPDSLKARALRWLAQREHSRLELRRKLMSAAARRDGVTAPDEVPDPSAEVDALLDWLVEQRHLSDARFVESRVHAREQRFGNRRIAQELARHGATLDAAVATRLSESEHQRARAVWRRKFGAQPPADAAARAKQMRFLAGRGFSAEAIRTVLRGGENEE